MQTSSAVKAGRPIDNAAVAFPPGESFRAHVSKISRESGIFFAGSIFTTAAGYFFRIFLARKLGAEALGVYALGMTIVGFLGIFAALGLPQAAVRFVAAFNAKGSLQALRKFLGGSSLLIVTANLVLGFAIVINRGWIVSIYHTPSLRPYLLLFCVIMLLGSMNAFLGQTLAGYKDVSRRTVITNFIGTPLNMVLAIALIAAGAGLRGYIIAQVWSAAAVLVLLTIAVWRSFGARRKLMVDHAALLPREIASFSAATMSMELLGFLLSQGDKVMIGIFLNARELGVYAVAGALVGFVPVVLQAINQIFAPTIADLHATGQIALLSRLFQRLAKWTFACTFPGACVLIIFSRNFMALFGSDFQAGWPIVVIGTIGQLINCAVGSVGFILLMSGHERKVLKVQIGVAAFVMAANYVLIPRWGITGAALAAALANAFTNLWCLYEVKINLGLVPFTRSYGRLTLPCLVTILALLSVRRLDPTFTFSIPLLAGSVALAYLIFGLMSFLVASDEDDRMVTSAIAGRVRKLFRMQLQEEVLRSA